MTVDKALEVLKELGMTDEEAATFIDGVKKGLKARREGKVRPWEEVKRELGITEEGGGSHGSWTGGKKVQVQPVHPLGKRG